MLLRFINVDGHLIEYELGTDPVTIGRSPDASLVVQGEKVSRFHCGIRLWDHDYVLKDYGSTNGTFLNDKPVEAAILRVGDVIRVGSIRIQVDLKSTKGARTILRELSQEMESGGKGYKTMLREIVKSTEPQGEKKDTGPAPSPAPPDTRKNG